MCRGDNTCRQHASFIITHPLPCIIHVAAWPHRNTYTSQGRIRRSTPNIAHSVTTDLTAIEKILMQSVCLQALCAAVCSTIRWAVLAPLWQDCLLVKLCVNRTRYIVGVLYYAWELTTNDVQRKTELPPDVHTLVIHRKIPESSSHLQPAAITQRSSQSS